MSTGMFTYLSHYMVHFFDFLNHHALPSLSTSRSLTLKVQLMQNSSGVILGHSSQWISLPVQRMFTLAIGLCFNSNCESDPLCEWTSWDQTDCPAGSSPFGSEVLEVEEQVPGSHPSWEHWGKGEVPDLPGKGTGYMD